MRQGTNIQPTKLSFVSHRHCTMQNSFHLSQFYFAKYYTVAIRKLEPWVYRFLGSYYRKTALSGYVENWTFFSPEQFEDLYGNFIIGCFHPGMCLLVNSLDYFVCNSL